MGETTAFSSQKELFVAKLSDKHAAEPPKVSLALTPEHLGKNVAIAVHQAVLFA